MGLRVRLIAALTVVALVPPLVLAWRAGPILTGLRRDMSRTIRAHSAAVVNEWFASRTDATVEAVTAWVRTLDDMERSTERLLEPPRDRGLTRRQERALVDLRETAEAAGLDGGHVALVTLPGAPGTTTLAGWSSGGRDAEARPEPTPPGVARWSFTDGEGSLTARSSADWTTSSRPGAALRLTGEIVHDVSHVSERLSSAVSAKVTVSRWLPGRVYDDPSLLVVDDRGRAGEIGASRPGGALVAVVDVDLSAVGREETRQLTLALLAALLAGLAGAVALALVSAQLLAGPLRRLTDSVSRVADGEPAAGAMPSGPGEVGRLASAVDRMLAALQREHGRRLDAERRAAWRDIAQRVAHEVRNPLSPIRLAVDNLKRARAREPTRLAESVDVEADAILQEVRRLDRLVREFSEFARLPAPAPRPARLGDVVRAAVRGQIPDAERISCLVEVDPRLEEPIPFDEDLIAQAVANLARNAVQAIGDGPGRIRGEVRAEEWNDEAGNARRGAAITIQDDGPGMPEDLCETIFEPYVTGRGEAGTGLGLAIARRIVLDHGGAISAENVSGSGARFTIRLPIDGRFLGRD